MVLSRVYTALASGPAQSPLSSPTPDPPSLSPSADPTDPISPIRYTPPFDGKPLFVPKKRAVARGKQEAVDPPLETAAEPLHEMSPHRQTKRAISAPAETPDSSPQRPKHEAPAKPFYTSPDRLKQEAPANPSYTYPDRPEPAVLRRSKRPVNWAKRDHCVPPWTHYYGEEHDQDPIHYRDSTPDLNAYVPPRRKGRWAHFADTSGNPPNLSSRQRRVIPLDSEKNIADYYDHGFSQPWGRHISDLEKQKTKDKKPWYKRVQHKLLHDARIPLLLRLIVWMFSAAGLALASSILRYYNVTEGVQPTTSPIIAICINSVAMLYLIYITYDEYTGKPIGLRKARAKMQLILLDLFFVCFQAANLSLQFEAVIDNGSCIPDGTGTEPVPCPQSYGAVIVQVPTQQALASVILVALIAWVFTFGISVLRVVERASYSQQDDD